MRIRTQIIISIIVSVLVIAVVGTILFFNNQQLAVASENERLADDIIQGSYALSNLQNDFLLHSSDRSRIQWKEKYDTLQDQFTRLRITDPVQQATLESILESNRQLLDIFSQIIASRETTGSANGAPADPELIQIRWNRLAVQTQGMIFDASRLSGLINADTSRIQQQNDWLIVFMISVLLLIILLNYVIVNRHILRSLDSLQKGTGIIGSGNFDYSLDESSKDELGDLSRAFNRMTVNLKAVTASKSDLEQEVAERKKSEELLKSSEIRYRRFFEAVRDGILIIDAETGTILDVNPFLIELLGFTHEQFLGKRLWEIGVFKDIAASKDNFKELQEKKYIHFENLPLETADGRQIYSEFVSFVYDVDDQKVMQCNIRDITQRKRAEQELQNSLSFLNSLIDQSSVSMWIADEKGTLIRINQACCDLMKITAADAVGKYNIFSDNLILEQGFLPMVRDVFLKGQPANFQITYDTQKLKNLELDRPVSVILDVSIFPVKDARGKITNAVIQHIDITESKRAEEELARSNKELQQFAYVSSHDLQEPLRMISSFVQLLEKRYKGKLDQDADEFIGFVVEGTSRMQRMIQDLLTFSRVQTQGAEFAPVDANEVFEKAVFNLLVLIKETGAVVTKDELPIVMGDETQLIHLFQNLIDNAIKFRRAGENPKVHISAQKMGNDWVFSVKDNGIGIDPQYFDRIFIIFQRLHSREAYEGTGIGLAVCMRIVERHGGRIWVESEPGRGSLFHFTLPAVK
jgi:PAS domain S-box-containing protein